jgi:hypothetical protein
VATVGYRGNIAVAGAPADFADFRLGHDVRSPGELLAHVGDLLEGSLSLLQGNPVRLTSDPLPWDREVSRFFTAATRLDEYLASDAALACPVEKLLQGPVGDALTHVGQIVMLRRAAGAPVRAESYFTADIIPGRIGGRSFGDAG